MILYKVFCKNYGLRKGELMGALIERRKDLRGVKQFESGLRWAKLTFGDMVQDKKAIFVIPNELNLNDDAGYMEKWKRSKEEFLEMVRMVDREMKKVHRVTK
jgi:hypothetical protein